MLIISRQPSESITVNLTNESCLITVTEVRGVHAVLTVAHTVADRPGEITPQTKRFAIDESLKLSEQINLTLVDVRGDKVRIAIEAPKSAAVHRLEVYEAIQRENRVAAQLRQKDPDDDNAAGSAPVPAKPKPKPPSLGGHAKPPREDNPESPC